MKLVANEDISSQQGTQKYVYVFGIDQSGAMGLFYPEDDGNVTNKFPKLINGEPVKEIMIRNYKVPIPSGTDNYFLLACDEPVINPGQVFNQEGVYSGLQTRGITDNNPLMGLIDMGNAGSRGLPGKTAATWSIQRYSFLCRYENTLTNSAHK